MPLALRPLLLVSASLLLATAAPAAAAPAWQPPTTIETEDVLSTAVAPDGTALLYGLFSPDSGYARIAVRPPGGPIGAPEPLPLILDKYDDPPLMAFDAAGNALIASSPGQVMFRPAGGPVGPARSLPGLRAPEAISMAPTGEALIGADADFGSGGVRVAFRPAGPTAQVDEDAVQRFPPPTGSSWLQLVGLQLDPDGAAIVVMRSATGLFQALRPAGQPSFGAPTEIAPAPGMSPAYNFTGFSGSQSGHVLFHASTGPSGEGATTGVAAYRAPGGGLATPRVLFTAATPIGVHPAGVNDRGDGLVVYTKAAAPPSDQCPDQGGIAAMHGAFLHAGQLQAARVIGPFGPSESSSATAVSAAGDRLALAYTTRALGDRCVLTDDSSQVWLRSYRTAADGLEIEDDHLLGGSTATGAPTGQNQWRQPSFTDPALALGAGGALALGVRASSPDVPLQLHVREDPAGTPVVSPTPTATPTETPTETPGGGSGGTGGGGSPGGTGTGTVGGPGAGPGTSGGGSTGTSPILPLVAQALVTPTPLTSSKPYLPMSCPASIDSVCRVQMQIVGRLQTARSFVAAARRPVVLGKARTTIAPGKTKRVRISLTKAGRKAVKRKRTTATLKLTVTADGRTTRSTVPLPVGKGRRR